MLRIVPAAGWRVFVRVLSPAQERARCYTERSSPFRDRTLSTDVEGPQNPSTPVLSGKPHRNAVEISAPVSLASRISRGPGGKGRFKRAGLELSIAKVLPRGQRSTAPWLNDPNDQNASPATTYSCAPPTMRISTPRLRVRAFPTLTGSEGTASIQTAAR